MKTKQYTLTIEQEEYPENPRAEWDHVGTMACWHSRYDLGDEQPDEGPEEYLENLPDNAVVLPLYLYDHSGVTMSTSSFSCQWDSGQVGYIWAVPDDNYSEQDLTQILQQEVVEYDQYLTGDVYGYTIEDEDGKVVDSCYGFYGREYCEEEARAMLEYYQERDLLHSGDPIMAEVRINAAAY